MYHFYHAPAAEKLRFFTSNYYHMCLTSPPYWRQRDNGTSGQIGLEKSPQQYVENLLEVFEQVYRVLRDDGTLWLNIGDKILNGRVLGLPWKIVDALQNIGFMCRAEIIWNKPNTMPSGVKCRPVPSHEFVFLFSKRKKFFYDWYALSKPYGDDFRKNIRSVWNISVARLKEQHFSAFPPELAKRCISAGTSEHGVCSSCLKPFARIIKRQRIPTRPGRDSKSIGLPARMRGNKDPRRHCTSYCHVGWQQQCECVNHENPASAIVLDPFLGSGTTAVVAKQMGRHCDGIDINKDYIDIAERMMADV